MDEHVALRDLVEEVVSLVPLGEPRLGRGGVVRVLEVGAGQREQRPEVDEAEWRRAPVDVAGVQPQLLDEQFEGMVAHRLADLEPNRVRRTPAHVQHRLHRLEEILGFLLDREVGVARHPEHESVHDLVGEDAIEMMGDHVLEQDEPMAVAQRIEAGEERRHLHPGERQLVAVAVFEIDGEVQRQIGDVGERMQRIDRERRQHREDLVFELVGQVRLVGRPEVVPRLDPDVRLVEQWLDVAPVELVDGVVDLDHTFRDGLELLVRCHPVGRGMIDACRLLFPDAGDPDLEELIQVGGDDRDVLDAFEQREIRVAGEAEHPLLEVEQCQVSVDVQIWSHHMESRR